eukprot:1294824-Amphidinium_carterae.1
MALVFLLATRLRKVWSSMRRSEGPAEKKPAGLKFLVPCATPPTCKRQASPTVLRTWIFNSINAEMKSCRGSSSARLGFRGL